MTGTSPLKLGRQKQETSCVICKFSSKRGRNCNEGFEKVTFVAQCIHSRVFQAMQLKFECGSFNRIWPWLHLVLLDLCQFDVFYFGKNLLENKSSHIP